MSVARRHDALTSVPAPPSLTKVINRSSKYKNRYIHRRDSLSLASLSLDDRDKLARIGVVTRAAGDVPDEEDEDDDSDEDDDEDEAAGGEGCGGYGAAGGSGGAGGAGAIPAGHGVTGGSGKVRQAVGLGIGLESWTGGIGEAVTVGGEGWAFVRRLVLPGSWIVASLLFITASLVLSCDVNQRRAVLFLSCFVSLDTLFSCIHVNSWSVVHRHISNARVRLSLHCRFVFGHIFDPLLLVWRVMLIYHSGAILFICRAFLFCAFGHRRRQRRGKS